jgi:hypothetical protein
VRNDTTASSNRTVKFFNVGSTDTIAAGLNNRQRSGGVKSANRQFNRRYKSGLRLRAVQCCLLHMEDKVIAHPTLWFLNL